MGLKTGNEIRMKIMVTLVGVAVGMLAACGALAANGMDRYADPHLEPAFFPLPENVEVLQLENGLQVILMRNPAQPMVGVYTQVKVGSAREDFSTSGMSHMLEHLLFNGSEKYTQQEQYDIADRAGAYNNANTTDFYTNFMTVVPVTELETGLDLQAQMLFHSTIPAEKFAKEQGIVLGELVQSRDWPGRFTEVALRQAVFAGSSLDLPTLGTRSTIEHMTRDDVYEFYREWYVPNNMHVTVAGNFNRDHLVQLLEKYYGEPAPGALPDQRLRPAPYIERTTSLTRRGGDQRVVALAFEAPTYGMADFFPFEIMTRLLQLDGSGVLTQALSDLSVTGTADLSLWWENAPGFGRLVLQFDIPEDAEPAACYRLVQDAVTAAVELGVSDEDILGIVRMAETETLLQREQLRMTGIYIAGPVALGGPDFFLSYLPRLREITAEQVTRALTNWLVDAPCQAVLIEPAAVSEEDDGGVPAGMQMPEGMQMPPAMAEAMRQMAAETSGEPSAGTEPEAVPASAPQVEIKVDRSELANGAVLVSQTNADSPLMAIHLAVRGRAILDRDNGQAGALDLVHRLLDEGYAGCDKTCLARRLRELGAVVKVVDDSRIPMDDYYTTGRFSFVRIETAAEYGPEVLELLTEEIQHAAFDDDDFERVRQERLTALERQQTSARSTANRLLNVALYGDNPLVLPPEGSVETLEALDFNQVRKVYRKAFSPENLVFAVVGPHGHSELREQIERLLPGRGSPAQGLPELPLTGVAETVTATVGGQMSAVRMGSILVVDPADADALRLAVAILADRVAMDLREERGLSYSVGATLSTRGGLGKFTAWINPPQERLEEGRAALADFITAFDAGSVSQEELDKIRSARTGRMMMRRLSSMGQAYYLAMAELDGDIGGYLGALTAYDRVTLDDVQRVSRQYLGELVLVTVLVD